MLAAISQRNDVNKHGASYDNLEVNYVNYFEKFGIKSILIPNCTDDVAGYINKLPIRAVILTGGNDIDPSLFGAKSMTGLSVSRQRDKTERELLQIATKKRIPVLGICRGMQFMNIFFGGKLRFVKGHVVEKHSVGLTEPALEGKISVNSYHKLGITYDDLCRDFRAFAQSDDGIIEGICHKSLPIAGLQWHPERKCPNNAVNDRIMKAFVQNKLFWKK